MQATTVERALHAKIAQLKTSRKKHKEKAAELARRLWEVLRLLCLLSCAQTALVRILCALRRRAPLPASSSSRRRMRRSSRARAPTRTEAGCLCSEPAPIVCSRHQLYLYSSLQN